MRVLFGGAHSIDRARHIDKFENKMRDFVREDGAISVHVPEEAAPIATRDWIPQE